MNLKKLFVLFTGILFCGILLFLGEIYFKQKIARGERIQNIELPSADSLRSKFTRGIYPNPPPVVPAEKRYSGPVVKDEGGFNTFTPGPKKIRHKFTRSDGSVAWDVDIHYDDYKRRIVPSNKKIAKSYLLLFGDSNIQGFGLNDENTIANFLSTELPDTNVYSYTSYGVYPYEILAKSEKIDRLKEVPEQHGVALYFLMSYHFSRNMGSINELGKRWNQNKHLVGIDEKGEFVVKGRFREENPVWFYLARILDQSSIMKYLKWDLVPGEKDLRIQIALIRKMQKNLEANGIKKFYVVLHPANFRPKLMEGLVTHLENEKIPYIHFGHWNMQELVEGPSHLVLDSHMSGAANKILGLGLAGVLRKDLR